VSLLFECEERLAGFWNISSSHLNEVIIKRDCMCIKMAIYVNVLVFDVLEKIYTILIFNIVFICRQICLEL